MGCQTGPHGNLNVHLLPEPAEHFDETVNREAVQLGLAHPGKVGRRKAVKSWAWRTLD
jgi:hypothetical protein